MESKEIPKSYTLNNGMVVPIIGLGTADMENIVEVVYNSIKDGTRLIDTASNYQNEEEVGKGINKALSENIVKREDLFIITKVDCNERDDPEKALRSSLKRLNLSYVDLYLDHWPYFICLDKDNNIIFKQPMHVVWSKMEHLVELGLTKSIGVSNYNVQSLCNLLSFCKIKPVFNEFESHPYLYQKNLIEFCRRENIRILAYNPIVRGPYCMEFHKEHYTDLLGEELIQNLAKKYNKTPGQIVLNWNICLGCIPIPRTSNVNRMKENLAAGDFMLEEEDFNKICALNKNYRYCASTNWSEHCGIDQFA